MSDETPAPPEDDAPRILRLLAIALGRPGDQDKSDLASYRRATAIRLQRMASLLAGTSKPTTSNGGKKTMLGWERATLKFVAKNPPRPRRASPAVMFDEPSALPPAARRRATVRAPVPGPYETPPAPPQKEVPLTALEREQLRDLDTKQAARERIERLQSPKYVPQDSRGHRRGLPQTQTVSTPAGTTLPAM